MLAAIESMPCSGEAVPLPAELLGEPLPLPPAAEARARLEADGFVVLDAILSAALAEAVARRLEAMLAGEFDTGVLPDKVPVARTRRPRVEQFVNSGKGDRLIGAMVQDARLASWVAAVAGWDSAEALQDQVWAKPPGSGPIAMHRDVAYMGEGVVTLWIAFDDVEPTLGPLEYAQGSHKWAPPPYGGYAPALFGKKDYMCELQKAAAHCGETPHVIQVLVPRGGGSIHDGRTWHGSGVNRSKRHRRGMGIHFTAKGARPTPPTSLALRISAQLTSGEA